MKKNTNATILFVLPLLLIFGFLGYRKSHPRKPSDDQLATATNPDYNKQEKDWLTHQFEAFFGAADISVKLANLPVRFIDSVEADVEKAELRIAIERIVQSLFAKTFDEYLSLRSVGESLVLNESSIAGQGGVLQRFYSIKNLPTSPMDVHKMFWSKTTQDGKRATLWSAASWQASWIECRKTTKLDDVTSTKSFSDSLMPRVPNCGIVGYSSSFDYSPTPKDVLSKEGHVVTALVYFLANDSSKCDCEMCVARDVQNPTVLSPNERENFREFAEHSLASDFSSAAKDGSLSFRAFRERVRVRSSPFPTA